MYNINWQISWKNDVPEKYHIDKNRFYENANEYCKQIGIEIPNLKR